LISDNFVLTLEFFFVTIKQFFFFDVMKTHFVDEKPMASFELFH